MNIVIDPDVFQASFHDFKCQVGINEIACEFFCHRFFRDAQGVLENEYRQIFDKQHKQHLEHPSIVLLQRILSEDGNTDNLLSSLCSMRKQFLDLGCSQPVEPELLGMLANARNVGLVLGLIGYDAENTRPRGLHKNDVYHQIRNVIPWLDVLWIGKPKIEIPKSDHSEYAERLIRAKSDAFETKAALYLQSQDSSLKCCTPPKKGDVGGEQIDVYGYRTIDENTKIVVIGECKLRRRGNERKSVSGEEIQQLRRKVIAVREAERNRGRNYTFEGILITNANDLDELAIPLIRSERDFRIRVLHVTLSSDWETSDEWGIVGSKWLDFDTSDQSSNDNLPIDETIRD